MIKETLVTLFLPYPGTDDRRVRVYVPAHEEGETLPVVYMTDGQNLFEFDERQFGCWYTREAVRDERERTGRAAIIVGIHNDLGFEARASELTPAGIGPLQYPPEMPEQVRRTIRPQGEAFDDFVIHTVMPAIEQQFPVKTGRENTAFCGSSSGGLQAFFTVLSHPDRFCISGVFSPAFVLYREDDVIRWTREHTAGDTPHLYFYSGGADELEQKILDSLEAVYDAMTEFYPLTRMNEVILPGERHHESAWAEVFKDFLHTFLYLSETEKVNNS